MTPGIFDWSHDDYHADKFTPVPSLAAGIAEAIVYKTPLHAWTRHRRLNPNYVEEVDSKFDPGTAAHSLLLEGIDKMTVLAFDDWRTKAAKEQRDQARAEGRVPLLIHQANKVQRMVEAAKEAFARNSDLAGYTLAAGMAEKSLAWNDHPHPEQQYNPNHIDSWFRCKPDWMSPDRKIMMDAKFTDTDAGPEAFATQIIRMAYDLRAAFYLRGNLATGGHPEAVYLFMVQEAKPPYATSFIGLPPAYVDLGAQKVAVAVARWRECMRTDKWPGYEDRIHWPEPPGWALAQWLERVPLHEQPTGLQPGYGTPPDIEMGMAL